MNETTAINLCRVHQDPAGFEYLVRRYRKQAYCHAMGWLNHREDALDACQEAFSRAFAGIVRLKKLERFYPWFYVILRNHCMDILNLRRRDTSRDHGFNPDNAVEALYDSRDFFDTLARKEQHKVIQDLLQSLKPEFREILMLKYFNAMNYNEIGTLLAIPRGTVMSRLYHARKAFHRVYVKRQREGRHESVQSV